jgi:hypothetical protein
MAWYCTSGMIRQFAFLKSGICEGLFSETVYVSPVDRLVSQQNGHATCVLSHNASCVLCATVCIKHK